jgi:hypothetical protein
MVNPNSTRCIKTLHGAYAVYARSLETMTEVLIGVTRKDPRGWINQPTDRPDEWIGFWPTRAEAVESLVWRANRPGAGS